MSTVNVKTYEELVDVLFRETVPNVILWIYSYSETEVYERSVLDEWNSKLQEIPKPSKREFDLVFDNRSNGVPYLLIDFIIEHLSHFVCSLTIVAKERDVIAMRLVEKCGMNLTFFSFGYNFNCKGTKEDMKRLGENVGKMSLLRQLLINYGCSIGTLLDNVGGVMNSLVRFQTRCKMRNAKVYVLGNKLTNLRIDCNKNEDVALLDTILRHNLGLTHVDVRIRNFPHDMTPLDAYWSAFLKKPDASHEEICFLSEYKNDSVLIDLVGSFGKLSSLKVLSLSASNFPLIGVVVRNALMTIKMLDVSQLYTTRCWNEIVSAFTMMRDRTTVKLVEMAFFKDCYYPAKYTAAYVNERAPSGCPLTLRDSTSYDFVRYHPSVNFDLDVDVDEIRKNIMLQRRFSNSAECSLPHDISDRIALTGLGRSIGSELTWSEAFPPISNATTAGSETNVKTIEELIYALSKNETTDVIHWYYDDRDEVPSSTEITSWDAKLAAIVNVRELKLVLSVLSNESTTGDEERRFRMEAMLSKHLSRFVTALTIRRYGNRYANQSEELIKRCAPNLISFGYSTTCGLTDNVWLGNRISNMVKLNELNVRCVDLLNVLQNVVEPIRTLKSFICHNALTDAPLRVLGTALTNLSVDLMMVTKSNRCSISSEINQIRELIELNPNLKSLSITNMDKNYITRSSLSTTFWNLFVRRPELDEVAICDEMNYKRGSDYWIDFALCFLTIHHLDHLDLSLFDFPLIGVVVGIALKRAKTIKLRELWRRRSWDQIVHVIARTKETSVESIDLSDFRGLQKPGQYDEDEEAEHAEHASYAKMNSRQNSECDFMVGHPTVTLTIGGVDPIDYPIDVA